MRLATNVLIIISLLFSLNLVAQRQSNKYISDSERFGASLLFGFNAAQIDGDQFTGFDKRGITGGIRGIVRLNTRFHFNLELLYSKKGSKIPISALVNPNDPLNERDIDLSYMDVPLYLKFFLKPSASSWHIEGGVIYSRLINSQISEFITDASLQFAYQSIESQFQKSDIAPSFGFGYSWRKGLELNFRYAYSIQRFYENEDFSSSSSAIESPPIAFLRNYYYSLSVSYTLFQ